MNTANYPTALKELGFSLEVLGKPYGNVDNDWPHIRFTVRLSYRGKVCLESPYSLGVGHVKPNSKGVMMSWEFTPNEKNLLYTWERKPYANFKNKQLWADVAAKLAVIQKVQPKLEEVLSGLLLDGSPFFNAESFEDWAREFGYEADSIKAKGLYDTCMETGRKLSASIPRTVIEQAQQILTYL